MNRLHRRLYTRLILLTALISVGMAGCNKSGMMSDTEDIESIVEAYEGAEKETPDEKISEDKKLLDEKEMPEIKSGTDEDNQNISEDTNNNDDINADNNLASYNFGYNSRYGVFLSYEGDLSAFSDYDEIVIDAQYFSKEQISEYKKGGHRVYSYLNIGSLETFRPYYNNFADITLSDYENWDEERWIDASNEAWQNYVLNTLAPALIEKGVDGFFVDNCDVYYIYQNDAMLSGVAAIMKGLKGYNKAVIMNGGDTFLDAYCSKIGVWSDVITGINQETVFSKIDWDDENHGVSDPEDRAYFTEYLERYSKAGADIYLLEYTKDNSLKADIDNYCKNKNYAYYISDSIELD